MLHQPVDVIVGNVPPVLAEVGGDPVRARLGRRTGRPHRIGMIAAARIPDRRHMVDIAPQAQAPRPAAFRPPCFPAGLEARSRGRAPASSLGTVSRTRGITGVESNVGRWAY